MQALEQEIRKYNNKLNTLQVLGIKGSADLYYNKAEKLIELGECSGDVDCFAEAIECYDMAIGISKSKLYYAGRAKAKALKGNADGALKDIEEGNKLSSKGTEEQYIDIRLKEILKLIY